MLCDRFKSWLNSFRSLKESSRLGIYAFGTCPVTVRGSNSPSRVLTAEPECEVLTSGHRHPHPHGRRRCRHLSRLLSRRLASAAAFPLHFRFQRLEAGHGEAVEMLDEGGLVRRR